VTFAIDRDLMEGNQPIWPNMRRGRANERCWICRERTSANRRRQTPGVGCERQSHGQPRQEDKCREQTNMPDVAYILGHSPAEKAGVLKPITERLLRRVAKTIPRASARACAFFCRRKLISGTSPVYATPRMADFRRQQGGELIRMLAKGLDHTASRSLAHIPGRPARFDRALESGDPAVRQVVAPAFNDARRAELVDRTASTLALSFICFFCKLTDQIKERFRLTVE
jgi:hypothetical protein